MKEKIGLIALDIDGTISDATNYLDQELVQFLIASELSWEVAFLTGRTLHWANECIKVFPFQKMIAVLNGACVIDSYTQHIVSHIPCTAEQIQLVQSYIGNIPYFCGIYTMHGLDAKNYIYTPYTDSYLVQHADERNKKVQEKWMTILDIRDILHCDILALRFFMLKSFVKPFSEYMNTIDSVQAICMKDSVNSDFGIVQITQKGADKGSALKTITKYKGIKGPIIACGDDENDIAMFEHANYRIVMDKATDHVKKYADHISSKKTLKRDLQQAVQRFI